jgi:uncharacterized Fe-S center protein
MSEDLEMHRKTGIELFNFVWTLLDKTGRTQEEVDAMIHAAHASRHHWGFAGTPLNFARGEWQISRVYATLKRSEPALYHARRCLEICQANNIADFDLAFAYEALARGYTVAGDTANRQKYLDLAKEATKNIAEEDDRKLLEDDLATV